MGFRRFRQIDWSTVYACGMLEVPDEQAYVRGQDMIEMLRSIGDDEFWYLASPYSKYHAGIEQAFIDVTLVAAWLADQGVNLFCPITHSHPMSEIGGLPFENHELWMRIDHPLMVKSYGMLVLRMPGWDMSKGMWQEREYFTAANKPIHQLMWPLELNEGLTQ